VVAATVASSEYARLSKEIKRQQDYQSDMAYAERRGLKIGREEGEKKSRQYFLELLNQGLSIEEIKERLINGALD